MAAACVCDGAHYELEATDQVTGFGYEEAKKTHTICDWDGVTGFEMPNCYVASCPGHKELDALPFTKLWEGQKEGQLYSNADFWDLIYPLNPDMPYGG